MNIAFDMMGGDFAPPEAVRGLQLYLSETSQSAAFYCIGDENILRPLLEQNNIGGNNIHVIHASQVIGYNEPPTKALKEKPHSSISIGFHLLSTGKADAFISAGNTGAMLVGTMYSIKTIEGVLRPTIPTLVPKLNGSTGVLLDVGLSVDCKPEQLNQFAILGSLFSQHILKVENPRIGLINVGEEEGKGNTLAKETYPLLKQNDKINFVGNIEGRDVVQDKTDVLICDGFTGNVILKFAESIYDMAVERKVEDPFLYRFHYEYYGGTPVLGVSKPVLIGHGISNYKAFRNMIVNAEKMIESDLCTRIRESFEV